MAQYAVALFFEISDRSKPGVETLKQRLNHRVVDAANHDEALGHCLRTLDEELQSFNLKYHSTVEIKP